MFKFNGMNENIFVINGDNLSAILSQWRGPAHFVEKRPFLAIKKKVFGNFLTFKWQFSRGSDWAQVKPAEHYFSSFSLRCNTSVGQYVCPVVASVGESDTSAVSTPGIS